MSIRVRDAVFIRSGNPAIVKDRNSLSGQLILDQDYGTVQKEMRHGYINGIAPEERAELYKILDDVKANNKEPRDRVDAINLQLAELEKDPTKLPLTRYLRAEMLHIMNSYNIKPKEYTAAEIKTR